MSLISRLLCLRCPQSPRAPNEKCATLSLKNIPVSLILPFMPLDVSRTLSRKTYEETTMALDDTKKEQFIAGIALNDRTGFGHIRTFELILASGFIPGIGIFHMFRCPIDLYFRIYVSLCPVPKTLSHLLMSSRFSTVHREIAHEYSDPKTLEVFYWAYLNMDSFLIRKHLNTRALSYDHVLYAYSTRPSYMWILVDSATNSPRDRTRKYVSKVLDVVIRDRMAQKKKTKIHALFGSRSILLLDPDLINDAILHDSVFDQ